MVFVFAKENVSVSEYSLRLSLEIMSVALEVKHHLECVDMKKNFLCVCT